MSDTNSLEILLKQLTKDQSIAPEFNSLLLKSEVYCLGDIVNDATADDDMEVEITYWEEPDGQEFVPFFTSVQAMSDAIEEDEQYLKLNAVDFLEMVQDSVVILNPEHKEELSFSPKEVVALLASKS